MFQTLIVFIKKDSTEGFDRMENNFHLYQNSSCHLKCFGI